MEDFFSRFISWKTATHSYSFLENFFLLRTSFIMNNTLEAIKVHGTVNRFVRTLVKMSKIEIWIKSYAPKIYTHRIRVKIVHMGIQKDIEIATKITDQIICFILPTIITHATNYYKARHSPEYEINTNLIVHELRIYLSFYAFKIFCR